MTLEIVRKTASCIEKDPCPELFLAQINSSAFCLQRERTAPTLTNEVLPTKLREHLRLKELGLNIMSTTIIPPNLVSEVDSSLLEQILYINNSNDGRLGFPETRDLIIRSSRIDLQSSYSKRSARFSEPAIRVINVGATDERSATLSSNQEVDKAGFFDSLEGQSYLMIHTDDVPLQESAIHGAMYSENGTSEMINATGTLHARNIHNNPQIPSVKVSAESLEDLFSLNPFTVIAQSKLEKETLFVRQKVVLSQECDNQRAKKIVRNVNRNAFQIQNAYTKLVKEFGKAGVMEFRLYIPTENFDNTMLHVMGWDMKF